MVHEKAHELGMALAESEEFARMNIAREALAAHPEILMLIDSYDEKQSAMMKALEGEEAQQNDVQVMYAEMERIHSQLLDTPEFVELIDAQNAFKKLMDDVNSIIGVSIGVNPPEGDDAACTHDCSTCGGCVH